MWQLLARKTQVYVIVAITVVIIFGLQAAFEWWDGSRPNLFKFLTLIVFVIGTGLTFVANRVWRWIWRKLPFLNTAFFPDLNGVWVGEVHSNWVDPKTGQKVTPIPTQFTIRQTLFDISIKQKTGESKSYSHRVIAEADTNADRYRLWYDYDNQPEAAFHFKSTQHQGFAWLEINLADEPSVLVGQYYTNRSTSGDMKLRRMSA